MAKQYTGPVQLVVLDFAGTLVDGPQDLSGQYPGDDGKGVKAPVITFDEILREYGIKLTWERIREPMGLYKKDHLRVLLETEEATEQFYDEHGREWTESDLEQIYTDFYSLLNEVVVQDELASPVSGAKETVDRLQTEGKLVSNTTGYAKETAETLNQKLVEEFGLELDFMTHSDAVETGRPAPWMIYQGMRELGVYPPKAVIKIGDTSKDIAEGISAGAWTVGLYRTGNDSFDELQDAGADYLIPSIREVPGVVRKIEHRLHHGDY